MPGGFPQVAVSLYHALCLFLLTAPTQSMCSKLCPSETCLFAGHSLGACASSQVEKDLSESPGGFREVDAGVFCR